MTQAERDEIEALLVFLANGTLEGEEKARVEAAVALDAGLQADLAALRALRTQVQAEAMPASPGAFGQARLLRDLDREARPGRGWFWPGAAAAAVALLLLQTAFDWRAGDLRLADGDVAIAEGPILTVAFSGTATEADIRALLLELDLSIVSGPSAIGLYRLAARDEDARERALQRLSARPDIVESAEVEE